ncbi:MAG: MFS transporter [Thermomicrobiales bacterium]|nr:MFS transporter [Thermomicrobiales bacterium]
METTPPGERPKRRRTTTTQPPESALPPEAPRTIPSPDGPILLARTLPREPEPEIAPAAPAIELPVSPPSLFQNPAFQAFWISRLLIQIAQGAMMYALLVLVVDTAGSSFYNSIFVICAVLPAIFFGLPAGVAVDAVPRRPLLVALNVVRFLFVISLAFQVPSIAGIFATALGIWTIHQFYAPAEGSTLPALVPTDRLTEAQALSNLALIIAQAVGLVILAPLLLKTAGPQYLFAICAALLLTAAFLVLQLPRITDASTTSQARMADAGIEQALLSGLRTLMGDQILFRVTLVDIIVGIGLSALVVIAPIYLTNILDSSSENTVFVFAPAAIGVIAGLRLAPFLSRHIELRMLATLGLLIFAACVAAFGFMSDIYRFLVDTLQLPLDALADAVRIAPLALMVMLFSVPAGFSSSVVGVAARTTTLLRTPTGSQGKVIATQSLMQNIGALLPTLVAGILADVIGVERVAIVIAVLMIAGASATFLTGRFTPMARGYGA